MSNKIKNGMQVSCFLNNEKLCDLKWDSMPNVGMGFSYKKKSYMITKIEDSKITLKIITNRGKKK